MNYIISIRDNKSSESHLAELLPYDGNRNRTFDERAQNYPKHATESEVKRHLSADPNASAFKYSIAR